MKHLLTILLGFIFPLTAFCVDDLDENFYYANALQLQGKIGGKYAIELQVKPVGEENAFSLKSGDCLEIEGTYAYLNQVKPIKLEGRYCPANGGIQLKHTVVGKEEVFEGKWNATAREITGTWTMQATGKSLGFQLTSCEIGLGAAKLKGFQAYLRSCFRREEPGMDEMAFKEIGQDANGCYLEGIEWGWNGDIRTFSASQLSAYCSYSSTARSSSNDFNFQLLPSTSGVWVLLWESTYNYDKPPFDAPEDEEGDAYESFSFDLFQWENGEAKNKNDIGFPKDFPLTWEGENPTVDQAPHIFVLQNRLALSVQGKTWKLKWENGKFVGF